MSVSTDPSTTVFVPDTPASTVVRHDTWAERRAFKHATDNSGKLFDTIMEIFKLKNDAALCRLLNTAPPLVSKIRGGHQNVSACMQISIYHKTGFSIEVIEALLAGAGRENKYVAELYDQAANLRSMIQQAA